MAEVIDLSQPSKAAAPPAERFYQPASVRSDQPLDKLTLIGASGWLETFWYADLRRISYHVDPDWDRSPVLKLRFSDPDAAEAVIQGNHLHRLHDDLIEQRIAWLWAMPANVTPEDGATVIRKIIMR